MNPIITYILNVFWKFNVFYVVRPIASYCELRGLNAWGNTPKTRWGLFLLKNFKKKLKKIKKTLTAVSDGDTAPLL